MADMGPKAMKGAGGKGLISKRRNWDEGGKKDFVGRIHPAEGVATRQKDAASVKQPSGKSMPPSAGGDGPKAFPAPRNTQSAKAPRLAVPAAIGRLKNIKQHGQHRQMGKTSGPDKGPKG